MELPTDKEIEALENITKILDKAVSLLKDPDDLIWILEHLDDVLGNAGLGSMLKEIL